MTSFNNEKLKAVDKEIRELKAKRNELLFEKQEVIEKELKSLIEALKNKVLEHVGKQKKQKETLKKIEENFKFLEYFALVAVSKTGERDFLCQNAQIYMERVYGYLQISLTINNMNDRIHDNFKTLDDTLGMLSNFDSEFR